MVKVVEALNEIRDELRELRVLYRGLVEKLVPVVEATDEERRAIEEPDEVADEEELLKAVGERRVHH